MVWECSVPKDRPWFKQYPVGFTLDLDYPRVTLYEFLDTSARRFPDKPAIIFYGKRINYSEVKDLTDRLATFLFKSGIKKGDRVAIYMVNSPQWVISYFAILRANAVVVPVNPMLRGEELEYIIKDSGSNMVLTTSELYPLLEPIAKKLSLKVVVGKLTDYLPERPELSVPEQISKVPPIPKDVINWSEAVSSEIDPPKLDVGYNDIAMIAYTAGSTGIPKGCIHTHATIISNAISAAYWERVSHSAIHLTTLPLFHVTGLIHSLLSPVYTGTTMVLLSRWDRKTALDAIEKYKVTHWISIATMVFDILADPELGKRNLSSLRVAGGGGMAVPKAVAERWEKLTGVKYIEGYGLSETISQTHLNPPENPKYGSLGIPDFCVDSLVIDPETGKVLNPGEIGEIVIYGPEIFKGYWNKPEETKKAFIEIDSKKYFRTGDVGYMDNDGYFFIMDRLKRMINRAGYKVWPAEVEAKLYEHPAVKEAVVIGTPDSRVGEEVKAFVVLKPEYKGKITDNEIIDFVKQRIASYKYPRIVEFVDSLPKTGAGKIDWRTLQEMEKKKKNGEK